MTETANDPLAGLSPNERALLERIPSLALRRLAAAGVRAKMRLQFTGWLQYLLPLGPAAALALLGSLALLVRLPRVATGLGLGAAALSVTVAFDILTVKLRLHPRERRPRPRESLDAFELMRVRRSCRSFQTVLLDEVDRGALLASVRGHVEAPTLGPTAVRLEYICAPLTVWPTVNATEFLVAIAPVPYDRRSIIDVGRTLQKVVVDATRLGLGTCWIGPGADHGSLKAHLGERFDSARDQIICVCAVGYPSRFVPLMIRFFSRVMGDRRPLSELFFVDPDLQRPLDPDAQPFARFEAAFEACRWAPSSYNGQTTRAVVRCDAEGALAEVDFYAATTSRFYAPVALGIWCANWEIGCDALGIEGRFEGCPPPDGELVAPRHDVTWSVG